MPKDYKEAARFYRLAAAQGNADAQYNLGRMYYTGEGLPQDYKEAVRWYRLAAAQRDAQRDAGAQYMLGRMYATGRGVPEDYVRAHMWFSLSASSSSGVESKQAIESRNTVAAKLTPPQLKQAQEMARKCQASNFKDCD